MTVNRYVFLAIVLALATWLVVAVRDSKGDPPVTPPSVTRASVTPDTFLLTALRARLHVEHARYLQAHRRVRQLTRTLQHSPTTREAIDLACHVYGSCSVLWRRAQCESGGYRYAHNASGASGLFQFLRSTWDSTPFASLSIWSPYAQALAAGWMQAHGRGGEWVCQ